MSFLETNSGVVKWIKRLLAWSVFVIPLMYVAKSTLYPFISLKTLTLYVFAEVIFFLWLYALLVKKEVSFRLNIVTGSFLIFILVIVLSAIFGVDPSLSFWSSFERMNGALTWLHLGALFVVASSVLEKRADWMEIFWINSVAASIISAITILGTNGLGLMNISSGAGALLGNTSFAGAYLLISFFFAFYLWVRNYKSRGLLSVVLILIFISPIFFMTKIWAGKFGLGDIFSNPLLILGEARAATMALYAGLGSLVLGSVFVNSKKKFLKIGSKVLLFVVAAISLSTIVMFFIPNSPVQNFISQEASKSRVAAWDISVQAWKARPILGYGVGSFTYAYQEFYNPLFLTKEYGADDWMDQAHSVGYEILSTTGILGALSFASLYITALVLLWGLYRKEEIDFWDAFIPTVFLVTHLIQNLTVFDTISTFQLFVLMFAFVGSMKGKEIKASVNFWEEGVGQSIASIGLVVCLILFVIVPYRSSRAAISFSKGSFITSNEKIEKMFSTIQSSRVGEAEKMKLLSELWRNQIVKFPQILRQYPEQVVLVQDKLIEEMEKGIERHPLDLRTSVTLARMSLFTSALVPEEDKSEYIGKAYEYTQLARGVSPKHQLGYWTMASVEEVMGNRDEAYRLAKEAYDLAPTAKSAKEILAQYE
ncbi:O-antigen ligase family protein [Candidatus Parcubacteria bacterium]|nr:O-antigen ligase family protein [Candidatus Parcubacteria bacterium]